MAGSGSQDGLLCVWDLHTGKSTRIKAAEIRIAILTRVNDVVIEIENVSGACMYSIQAHDGCILALEYSASYVISLGLDDRLCVWDRFQGHLLNTIPMVRLKFEIGSINSNQQRLR